MGLGGGAGEAGDFPVALRERFRPIRIEAVGAESVVHLAEPLDGGCAGADLVVVKVHRNSRLETDQLVLLGRLEATRHVPRIHDYGNLSVDGAEVGWMAQEYCAHGSLDALIRDALPLGDAELRAIVAELAECLNFWLGAMGLTHTDVKPANILVRSRNPYELLIGDFGGIARNVRVHGRDPGGLLTTWAYAAPETARGRRGAPAAWWALGIIAYQLLLGRTPYEGAPSARVRELLRAGRRPALDAVTDPEWRRLIEGLLVVDPARRWTYEQVVAWVADEHRPPRFNGRTYRDVRGLADDLERNWRDGAAWLAGNGGRLADWLVRQGAEPADVRYLRGLGGDRARRALIRLTAQVIPDVTPRYEGRPIDAPGLLGLARGGPADRELLREVVDGGVLADAARHRCGHPGCRGRCAVLDRVHADVPEIVARAEGKLSWLRGRVLRSRPGRPPAELPSAREWPMLWAWAAELTLLADAAERVRALAAAVPREVPWWPDRLRLAEAADPATLEGRADLVVAQLLAPHAWRAAGGNGPHRR